MQKFDENPVLNSPYAEPARHWVLSGGKPTGMIGEGRRPSEYVIPFPVVRRGRQANQGELKFKANANINHIRGLVDKWRKLRPEKWQVTPVTERLLLHWRESGANIAPFFCQIEAIETLVWLHEVAGKTAEGSDLLSAFEDANNAANKGLFRLASKMATGSGKTTVMAMLIAYHAVNKSRAPKSGKFSDNFLVITPGITIRDRLRVLLPHDPENYYEKRGIVPPDMLKDIKKARVLVCNYHAFGLRETRTIPKKAREILRGNAAEDVLTKETEGQMLARTCADILRAGNAVVINDESHHCYRRKENDDGGELRISSEEKEEAKKNEETARVWISGIESLACKCKGGIRKCSKRKGGKCRVELRAIYDLSATPFFLKGSGYPEGTLFPWVVSDFSLMDAIESGIVKLPRIPVEDGATEEKIPIYRNIYQHVKDRLPKRGRSKQRNLDPNDLPSQLTGALESLYRNYKKTYDMWRQVSVPPVFIIVCNNSSTSKLVYDYISGYEAAEGRWAKGALELFSNISADGKPLKRPHTMLIDSYELESGEALSPEFKKIAAGEIEVFKRDMRAREPGRDINKITDADLLREVMNTVGREGKLGEQIRCVVSVSMLTEGWDTSNVTHICGIRAFGTQLLCEQVVGRALRRMSYETEDNGMFAPEYADIFGVPFVFALPGKVPPPPPPPLKTRVRHLDERALLEINFPRIRGYKIKPPEDRLVARFDENSRLRLEPKDAPPKTESAGIVGKGEIMTLDDLRKHRINEVVFNVAAWTAKMHYRDENGLVPPARFRDLVPIVRRWMKDYLTCLGGTFPQYLLWQSLAGKAALRIARACTEQNSGKELLQPIPDPFTPEGSTFYVDFQTSKKRLHHSAPDKSHVNIAVCDSDWEMNFCQMLEDDAGVYSYVRNVGLDFTAPYIADDKRERKYYPDFIALVNDRDDKGDLLHLIIEIKGYKDGDGQAKADTMNRFWVPSVNNDGRWGRWAFVEIMDMQDARAKLAEYTAPTNLTRKGKRTNGKENTKTRAGG
ncbi:MAG: BPTD_3080 family restriction endonuclease [Gammaproteobacteria bacterium]